MIVTGKNLHFSDAIALTKEWPVVFSAPEKFDHAGYLAWAKAYLEAAEVMYFSEKESNEFLHFAGPVMQMVGVATELTLKNLLRGGGYDERTIKSIGHNTYMAYFEARQFFDEVKFVNLVFSNTIHLDLPEEVSERLKGRGDPNPNQTWRIYFDHLRLLDTMYDRPFRSRYATPGSLVLPEPYIILAGTKILTAAMEERV